HKKGKERKENTKKKNKKNSDDPFATLRKKNKASKPEWAQFFEDQVEDQPFYSEFNKNKKKKKK
ncbi:MAG: hypothetical protein II139_05630, partial [Lachnospiraceae bacterium]|nr:hypothetical protein [Lachnospiraceae bacterium]